VGKTFTVLALSKNGDAKNCYRGIKKGLIAQDLQKISPTLLGQRYLNNLLELFLN
jgi:hypothetical protein